MANIVIVPGWLNSGPGHWQTRWAESLPNTMRVEQDDWLHPTKAAWLQKISETIDQACQTAGEKPIVVAHSLGCIAVSHLPEAASTQIASALLVAPADPERRGPLCDFAPVPHTRLPYPSILVASDNDPYCPVRLAGAYARAWGSQFIKLHAAGHINVEAGFGEWPEGLALLRSLGAWTPDLTPPPAFSTVTKNTV